MPRMARTVIRDGEEYSFKNGEWIDLHGCPASPSLRDGLYETYLNSHYAESKTAAMHLPYAEALSVADEYYDRMDTLRRSYGWPDGARKDHYFLRELAAEVAAYYEVALDKYFDTSPRLNDELKHILYRLSSSLRVIPSPDLCRVLILEYLEKTPMAVGEELLASVIAACSDMFKDSGFADLDSLEDGIGYFVDAYAQSRGKPSLTVKRAVKRLYKYASEATTRPKVVDEFISYLAELEQRGFFTNC